MTEQTLKKPAVPDLDVEEVADGGAVIFDPSESSVADGRAAEDAPKTASGGDADPDPDATTITETEELAAAETDEAREAIRARRRQERRDKRERRRNHTDDLRLQLQQSNRQLAELTNVVQTLQKRSSGTELAQLDEEIARGEDAMANLRSSIAEATKQQNGEIVADATERMMQVNQRLSDLKRVRVGYVQNTQRAATQAVQADNPPAQLLNPRVRELGQAWAQKNSWYDPRSKDLDTQIVKKIDDAVMQDGYDPGSQDYWDELSDRVARYLPHRARPEHEDRDGVRRGDNLPANGRKPSGSVVTGSGREGSAAVANGAKRGSYTLSADRVRALKDAGVWDDPAKRTDAIRRYREYDADAARRS